MIAADDDRVGSRVARAPSRRDRDRSGRQPDSRRTRAGDHRRGVQQPDRGRSQGDRRVRGRASQRGRRQQAPEDARGTARRACCSCSSPPAPTSSCLRFCLGVERVDFGNSRRTRSRASSPRRGWRRNAPTWSRGLRAGASIGRACARRSARGRARAFVATAAALDGSGSVVAAHVAAVQAAMQDAMTELDTAQAEEVASLTAELEQAGYPDRVRVARTQPRRLGDQQKRAHRHVWTELLLEGITTLETVYRDALAGPRAPTLNVDRPMIVADARRGRGARRVPRRPPGAHRAQPERDAAPRASAAPSPRRGRATSGYPSQRGTDTLARRAGVAQMAEQRTRNAQAKGSSPFSGSTFMGRSGESRIPRFAVFAHSSWVAQANRGYPDSLSSLPLRFASFAVGGRTCGFGADCGLPGAEEES